MFSFLPQDGNKAHHCAVERVDSAPVLDVLLQFDVPINVRNNVRVFKLTCVLVAMEVLHCFARAWVKYDCWKGLATNVTHHPQI